MFDSKDEVALKPACSSTSSRVESPPSKSPQPKSCEVIHTRACGRRTATILLLTGTMVIAAPSRPRELSLLAAGDLMLGAKRNVAALREDAQAYFRAYREPLRKYDVVFANLETPLTSRGTATAGKSRESLRARRNYIFRAPPQAASGLALAGFDVLSLANNHLMDYGLQGLRDTRRALQSAGVLGVGAGLNEREALAPRVLTRSGVRIAFLAVSDVLPRFSAAGPATPGVAPARGAFFERQMPRALQALRRKVNWVVVSVHWGAEKSSRTTQRQRSLGRRLIDWGADLVIGHHTHRLGTSERYRHGLIHYSLGNFIGNARAPAAAWEVTLRRGAAPNARVVTIHPSLSVTTKPSRSRRGHGTGTPAGPAPSRSPASGGSSKQPHSRPAEP